MGSAFVSGVGERLVMMLFGVSGSEAMMMIRAMLVIAVTVLLDLGGLRGGGAMPVMAGPRALRRCRESSDGLGSDQDAQHEDHGLASRAPAFQHLVQPHSRHGILIGKRSARLA